MSIVHSDSKDPNAITGKTVLVWLFCFFGVIFAANGVFLYFALGSFPGVAVESSYEAGQSYNQEIAAAKAQADLNWQVSAHFERAGAEGGKVLVTAADAKGDPLYGIDLKVSLKNPVHAQSDLPIVFRPDGGGRYIGQLDNVPAGNWDLILEISQDGERKFKSQNRIYVKD